MKQYDDKTVHTKQSEQKKTENAESPNLHRKLFIVIVLIMTVLGIVGVAYCLVENDWMRSPFNDLSKETDTQKNQINTELSNLFAISEEQNVASDYFDKARLEKAIIENVNYKVQGYSENTVTVVIDSPNLAQLFEESYDSINNQSLENSEVIAQVIRLIVVAIENKEFERISTTVTVPYVKNGKGIELTYTTEFMDAVYGRLYSSYSDIQE